MESNRKKSFEESLNEYLSKDKVEESIFMEHQDLALSLFSFNNSFQGNFQRALMLTKKKMAYHICQFKKQYKDVQLGFLQLSLENLVKDNEIVLQDGIITFYEEILQQKQLSKQKCIIELLEKLLLDMEILLRYYFVDYSYKEKNNSLIKNNSRSSKRKILSEKKLNSGDIIFQKDDSIRADSENEENDKEIFQLWEEMKEQSIQKLFNQYINKESSFIGTTLEVCRICSQKIKLKSLERHVNLCSKKYQIKTKLNEVKVSLQLQMEKIKSLEKQLQAKKKSYKQQKDQELLRIIRHIKENNLSSDVKRRSSLIENKKQDHLISCISEEIRNYAEMYQENLVLDQLCKIYKNKYFLQKKLENLERNLLFSEHNESQRSQIFTINSFQGHQIKTKTKIKMKNKKSIFAENSSFSSSSKDSKSSCSIKQRQQLFRSINVNAKRSNKRKQNKQVTFIQYAKSDKKICKSMSEIKSQFEEQRKMNVNLSNFQIIKFLGKGAFGRVYLGRRVDTTDLYALKLIPLQEGQNEKDLQLIQNEHEIFKKIEGDHLVKAPFSFSEDSGHFFVLEYMPGGDLGRILEEEVYLEEHHAKFYIAEIVLAIEHLHNKKIIHRDLKPENLVIDSEGHLKLTDFGLSDVQIKKIIKQAKTLSGGLKNSRNRGISDKNRRKGLVNENQESKLIGTPDYIAPQIINKISTDNMSIDWWSLGVITYEILIGCRPFCGDTLQQIIGNIKNFTIEWPEGEDQISQIAKDFILKLLNKDFQNRLGAQNINDIKTHPFFEGINWDNIKKQTPPFLPKFQNIELLRKQEEDLKLRAQIEELSQKKGRNKVKLQKFVRYDILKTQTINSAGKKINQRTKTLKKLMSIAEKLTLSFQQEEQDKGNIRISLQQDQS